MKKHRPTRIIDGVTCWHCSRCGYQPAPKWYVSPSGKREGCRACRKHRQRSRYEAASVARHHIPEEEYLALLADMHALAERTHRGFKEVMCLALRPFLVANGSLVDGQDARQKAVPA